jgi:hypothetical protein
MKKEGRTFSELFGPHRSCWFNIASAQYGETEVQSATYPYQSPVISGPLN